MKTLKLCPAFVGVIAVRSGFLTGLLIISFDLLTVNNVSDAQLAQKTEEGGKRGVDTLNVQDPGFPFRDHSGHDHRHRRAVVFQRINLGAF